jgi:uncharacterized damage-inducible protein DinB
VKSLFLYNWEVRDAWFHTLNELATEELFKERNAGIGSIFKTLFHIIDVEYSWIRAINGKTDIQYALEDYKDMEALQALSERCRIEIREYLELWTSVMEFEAIKPDWMEETFLKGEILRHIIAHEIHHVGQLSIWSTELAIKPVSSDFIRRGIFKRLESL